MKILLCLFCLMMIICCSGNSSPQDLIWYDYFSITNITGDPDRPEEFKRVSIGISAQVFYISRKSADYKDLMDKTMNRSSKNEQYNIAIENKTNMIRAQ